MIVIYCLGLKLWEVFFSYALFSSSFDDDVYRYKKGLKVYIVALS